MGLIGFWASGEVIGKVDRMSYTFEMHVSFNFKWKFKIGCTMKSSPAIGDDGTIYVGSYDGYLYAINPDGTLKWKFKTGDFPWHLGVLPSSPAIGEDGTIYVGSGNSYLYAINPDSSLKWKLKADAGIRSSPAIGEDGTIYVGSDDGCLYAVNPDGTLKWKFKMGDFIYSSPAIGKDGTIYVGASYSSVIIKCYIYAIPSDSKGLADSPWPMFRHDLKHTGRQQ